MDYSHETQSPPCLPFHDGPANCEPSKSSHTEAASCQPQEKVRHSEGSASKSVGWGILEDDQHTSLSNKTVPGVTGLSSQLLERLRQEDC